ncbi:MAG TPA: transporter substrate-binding domain-containing protein [Thermoanaerobaculia bacterium]|nr:transporter substrate-binding domain-containing protein [Thermoanaerobaculia bacterium]
MRLADARTPIASSVQPVATAALLATALLLLAAGCGGAGPRADRPEPFVETGDLPDVIDRGFLRVMMPPQRPEALERRTLPLDVDRREAIRFAEELGLEPVFYSMADRQQAAEAVAAGHADLAVARLRPSDRLEDRLDFSVPVDHVRQMLVVPADRADELTSLDDLSGLQVVVPAGSIYPETMVTLQQEVPDLQVVTAEPGLDEEQLIYRVGEGTIAATVADEDLLETVLTYRDDVAAALALTQEQPVAWAMREGSMAMKEALDGFLTKSALTAEADGPYLADLDEVRRRGVLRVLTRNNPVTYFLHRGEEMGFEYELARRFARKLGVKVQMVVPREPGQLAEYLLAGRGDLVAASMTVDPARQRLVRFSRPYNQVSELVITRAGAGISGPRDLAGHTVVVQRSARFYPELRELAQEAGFDIAGASEETEADELIDRVARGEYDATVVDSNMLDVELTWRDDVESAFPLGDPLPVAWAVRPSARQLHAAIDRFLAEQEDSRFFNVLMAKYFSESQEVSRRARELPLARGELSPYDEQFRAWGRRTDIDWRLLVAQAFQESRFDPTARSWAGAVGVMQIMPRTALHMGVKGNLRDPEVSIRAGARYMEWLLDRFDRDLPLAERLRFALASYNAGRGHILDGRRLARERGLDGDVWADNVEAVLPLLAKRSYARQARYGYCRCDEPVDYVNRINDRYLAYTQIEERQRGR